MALDQKAVQELEELLQGEEMTTRLAVNDVHAVSDLENHPPDAVVVIVDPAGDWYAKLCLKIRERTSVPLLLLGGKEREPALARCLDAGADAHLLWPCTREMLLAQLYALLRRAGLARPGSEGKYDVGSLAIDVFKRQVRVGGEAVELTPTEFEILRCLFGNSGRAVGYRSLVRQALGYDCSTDEARRLLKVHIHNLRQKIEPVPERPTHILNVRGFGYLFERRRHPRDSTSSHAQQSVSTES